MPESSEDGAVQGGSSGPGNPGGLTVDAGASAPKSAEPGVVGVEAGGALLVAPNPTTPPTPKPEHPLTAGAATPNAPAPPPAITGVAAGASPAGDGNQAAAAPVDPAPAAGPAQGQAAPPLGTASFRGPLRFEMETSTNTLVAGRMFSLYVRITNPYDVEVTVNDVHAEVAVEFWLNPDPPKSPWHSLFKYKPPKTTVLRASPILPRDAAAPATAAVGTPAPVVVLQPGNSILHEFTLKTSKSLFFTPSVYFMHVQVSYTMEQKLNHDTVKTSLNIKSPIYSLVLGAVFGGLLGTYIKRHSGAQVKAGPTLFAEYTLGMITAAVMVVVLARKKDAQPFVSVEDVYGGFFIGLVAGYSGPSVLTALLNAPGEQPPGASKGGITLLNIPDALAMAPRTGSEFWAMTGACLSSFLRWP